MVAVEAAACGALPLSAAHSGLAEVTAVLREAVDEDVRPLLEFERGPGAVREIADKLVRWLTLDEARRAAASAALSDLARARYGWESVAESVIAASRGELGRACRARPFLRPSRFDWIPALAPRGPQVPRVSPSRSPRCSRWPAAAARSRPTS